METQIPLIPGSKSGFSITRFLTKPPSGGFKLVRKTKNEDKKMKTLNVRF